MTGSPGKRGDAKVTTKLPLTLGPPTILKAQAAAFRHGAEKGYTVWSYQHKQEGETPEEYALRYVDALLRHTISLWVALRTGASPLDPDSGLHEICGITASASILAYGLERDGLVKF